MLFNSLQFLVFLPVVLVVCRILPQKVRYLWLLAASYYFYMCWNAKYALLILGSTVVTYLCSLALSGIRSRGGVHAVRNAKRCRLVSLLLNFGVLFVFKYYLFACETIVKVVELFGGNFTPRAFDVLLPVGISFYTLQAVGYTIDVYRGTIPVEKNFFRYALFVSFFPQLVAGPIERSGNLLHQLEGELKPTFEDVKNGLIIMLWGYFMKLVLADRIVRFVDTVYAAPREYPGWFLIVGTFLFSIQIYCDFYGYSTIAMGAARMLGIRLMENFQAPFLSENFAEVWRCWHISLSSWLRDYLYIPLGGSRKGKVRKYVNLLITFSVSGLWHGANWNYVFWGFINGLYQVVDSLLRPVTDTVTRVLHLHPTRLPNRVIKVLFTKFCFDLSLIFFRTKTLGDAFYILGSYLTPRNAEIFTNGALYECGLTSAQFIEFCVFLLILFLADLAKKCRFSIHEHIEQSAAWVQVAVIVVAILVILTFGVYGPGFNAANFIYFQF